MAEQIKTKWRRMREKVNRVNGANLLMVLFIVFTSIGVALVAPSAGWGFIAAGVTSGIFGYLLGLE